MSQEIMEGIRTIEREKGIETGTLVAALEDALLAAYKKTPGAARHAEVILDDEGEFRVFSITIAALTLASSQFGPRLLRNFMRDLGNQLVLGTFVATYLYCLLVLRTVRGAGYALG